MTRIAEAPTADKFVARLPVGMRQRLSILAARNLRSMNSELILALEKHLKDAKV